MDPSTTTPTPRPAPGALLLAVRWMLLAIVAGLSVLATREVAVLWWLVPLAVAAVAAAVGGGHRWWGPAGRLAEVVTVGVAAAGVAATADRAGTIEMGFGAYPVLPYLAVPLAMVAFRRHTREALGLLLAAILTLAGAGALTTVEGEPLLFRYGYLAASAQWLLLGGLGALAAGAVYRLVQAQLPPPQPYAEATRLLTQLRNIARQLPGATLDPGGIAEHLLDEVRAQIQVDRAAVLSASGGGRLVLLAQAGQKRVDWETALDADSALADAWASQQPQTDSRSQTRSHGGTEVSALVLPLVSGVRTVGLVVVETDTPGAYPPSVVEQVRAVVEPAALRLEAALLFDEVRSIATNEERQRLAREIHDGVAQELVMVGYGIDNAMAALPEGADQAAEELRSLRGEVTRVVTELRMSLFELRSEVDRHGGLAAAIADYARTVGAQAGLRVHLSLDESTARLPAATEAELLRIAQEAITNARKHAGAANLWVTCTVDPPMAQVVVSDDGQGIPDHQPDGRYGLAIMKERAERIRGRLEITPRHPSGTTVAVVLGGREPAR